jgi:hypothetical protein
VDFAYLLDQLCADPEVERSQMMGHAAAKTRGKLFAMSFDDDLVVKVGRERVDAMIAASEAQPFDPGGMNRPMKDWAQVPPGDDWLALAEEAKERL